MTAVPDAGQLEAEFDHTYKTDLQYTDVSINVPVNPASRVDEDGQFVSIVLTVAPATQ